MNLKQATDKDQLEQFINERSSLKGDSKKFNQLMSSICQSKKATQETSAQESA